MCNEFKYEPIFSFWLHHKAASIPGESEALRAILESHIPTNVQKRKRKRNAKLPTGPERYDTSSNAWVEILEERNKKKQKPNNGEPKQKENKKSPNANDEEPKQKKNNKYNNDKHENPKQNSNNKTPKASEPKQKKKSIKTATPKNNRTKKKSMRS